MGEGAGALAASGDHESSYRSVVARIDPRWRLIDARPLMGGVSAQVTALTVERPSGDRMTLVLRRHGETDLNQNPHVASHEYRVLQIVQAEGLAAPAPMLVDDSCEIFPTPYLVTEFVEGESHVAPQDEDDAVVQMADYLARLHAINGSAVDLAFLRQSRERLHARLNARPVLLDEGLNERRVRDALLAAMPIDNDNQNVLLHGDYWPGNILWRNGRLAAVIDWEDAGVGNPLADVSNGRLEVLWAFGEPAMERFTERYLGRNQVDATQLALWDLAAALRHIVNMGDWGLESEALAKMRALQRVFTDRALFSIGA